MLSIWEFQPKTGTEEKKLKLIYLLLFISSDNKSFERQFRLSFLENRAQETEDNKLHYQGHLSLLGDWIGVVLNCIVGMF